jgi:hypothetical protein
MADLQNWATIIPEVQFVLNTHISRRHGSSPFSLMFVRSPYPNPPTDSTLFEEFDEESWIERGRDDK